MRLMTLSRILSGMVAAAVMASLGVTLLTSCLNASGLPQSSRQSTIRKLPAASRNNGTSAAMPQFADTIICGEGDVDLRGFHKPLRSRRESVFATNNTTFLIKGLFIDLTYTDTRGRTLHRQRRTVFMDIPAGETRRLDFPSWDRQQVFYYTNSTEPPRADGTAFDVRCHIDSMIVDTGELELEK